MEQAQQQLADRTAESAQEYTVRANAAETAERQTKAGKNSKGLHFGNFYQRRSKKKTHPCEFSRTDSCEFLRNFAEVSSTVLIRKNLCLSADFRDTCVYVY